MAILFYTISGDINEKCLDISMILVRLFVIAYLALHMTHSLSASLKDGISSLKIYEYKDIIWCMILIMCIPVNKLRSIGRKKLFPEPTSLREYIIYMLPW